MITSLFHSRQKLPSDTINSVLKDLEVWENKQARKPSIRGEVSSGPQESSERTQTGSESRGQQKQKGNQQHRLLGDVAV